MGSLHNRDNISQVFGSQIIEVIAGPENRIYHIHASTFSLSEFASLQTLVAERWNSGSTKAINWSHTDSATVERFFTYLYTGNYHIPDPSPLETSTLAPEAEPVPPAEPEPDAEAVGVVSAKAESDHTEEASESGIGVQRAIMESIERRPLTPFDQCFKSDPITKTAIPAYRIMDIDEFPYQSHRYKEPLLALARLYCFSLYHLCPSLQNSTLRDLVNFLQAIDCRQPHAATELTELSQYTYSNTNPEVIRIDPLRKVVSQFVAINFVDLMHSEFEDFFGQGGDFTLDIARKLRRHLAVTVVPEESGVTDAWRTSPSPDLG